MKINKKVVAVGIFALAFAFMGNKPAKKNNYLYLEVPEEVDEVVPDRNTPADGGTPMTGYKRNL